MAEDAQRIANKHIDAPFREDYDGRIDRFNKEFGNLTFGSHFTTNPWGFWGTWASGRDDVLGHRDYQGDSGFHPDFRDSLIQGEDAVHHFGAYFSAGLTGHKFASDQHRADDRENKNWGDVRLGDQARRLGDYLRKNRDQLKNVGQLIRNTICNGGAVPK
jgi:hypothetical protein